MSHGLPFGHSVVRERLMTEVSDLFCENAAINNAIAALHFSIFFLSAGVASFAAASSAEASVTQGVVLQASPHCWLVKAAFICISASFHSSADIGPALNLGIGTFPVCSWLLRIAAGATMMLVC